MAANAGVGLHRACLRESHPRRGMSRRSPALSSRSSNSMGTVRACDGRDGRALPRRAMAAYSRSRSGMEPPNAFDDLAKRDPSHRWRPPRSRRIRPSGWDRLELLVAVARHGGQAAGGAAGLDAVHLAVTCHAPARSRLRPPRSCAGRRPRCWRPSPPWPRAHCRPPPASARPASAARRCGAATAALENTSVLDI